MAYREWLPEELPGGLPGGLPEGDERHTVVCVHGLTRNGGDFDRLATTLVADGFHVVCPDIVGRGLSDRLSDVTQYGTPQYVADCIVLLAHLDRAEVDWIGTSMGGLIGMILAGDPARPIRRLLLNDIGPVVSCEGLTRIAEYVGKGLQYADFASAEAALRTTMASFGPHDDQQFRLLSRHYFVAGNDGWVAHYDPAIALPFREPLTEDVVMWPVWNAIDCPVMVVRGAESDVLSAKTALTMTLGGPDGAGPQARLRTVAGVGHAPTLIADDQLAMVREWLVDE